MNKQLKLLAEHAKIPTYHLEYGTELCIAPHLEKFAELIVRECLSIVKSNTYGPNGEYDYSYTDENSAADDRADTIYKDIAYRFGVGL